MEDEFTEHIQKRVRNLLKRKSKLEGYEKIRQEDPSKLNSDQINALAHKDSVDAPLKELQDMLKLYQESKVSQKKAQEAKVAQEVAAAEQRGRDEARDTLRLFSVFLRTAAVKHQVADTPAEELAAVDQLLQQLYLGDDSSLESIDKLAAKSDEIVHGTWTYAQINALTAAPQTQETQPEETEVDQPEEKISFLQEDELEADKAVEVVNSVAEAATPGPAATGQGQREVKPKKEKNGDKDNRKPRRKNTSSGAKPDNTKTDDGWEKAGSRRGGDKKQQQNRNSNNKPRQQQQQRKPN